MSLLKQGYNVNTNLIINAHISWEDEDRSYWVMDIIATHISRVGPDQTDHFMRALYGMISIRDSLQQWRIRMLLGTKGTGPLSILCMCRSMWANADLGLVAVAAGGLLDAGNKRNGLFMIAVAQLLVSTIHTIPLAATFLYRTRGTAALPTFSTFAPTG